MWIFTKYGLFSVVAAREDGGRGAVDQGTLQVRARVLAHIRGLCGRFDALRGARIIETPRADYLYRIIVPKGVWAGVAAELAGEIDYDNFKDACVGQHDPEDARARSEYLAALHEVWCVGNDMQGRVHGKGAYAFGWAPEDPWPEDEIPR